MNWLRRIKELWVIFGITLALFLVLEFFAFVAAKVYNPHDPKADLPVYRNFGNSVQFWAEHNKTWKKLQYVPYVIWKRPAFLGKWTNIDARGDRVTCYNTDKNLGKAKKIFMFGGSTLWGTGAPDWETIPSYLAKMLNENSPRYIVYNYAETGHVSSQELNRLISEIKIGNIPDLVIFYDGINDAYEGARALSALKTPGYHTFMDRCERIFKREKLVYFLEIIRSSYLARAVGLVMNKCSPDINKWERNLKPEQKEQVRKAIIKTVQYLLANYEIASAIADKYGFKVIVIIQPYLNSTSKVLQDYEKKFLPRSSAVVDAAYAELNKEVKAKNFSCIYNLSDIFKTIDEPIYIDWAHMGPQGNYYIAKRIAEILKSRGY